MKHITYILLAAVLLALSACGGGGGGSGSGSSTAQAVINQSSGKRNTVSNYAIGDLNGDGLDDIVIGGWTGGTNYLTILIQNTDGTLTDRTIELVGRYEYPGSEHIFIADFDHDGYPDILSPGADDKVASIPSVILWGSANGKFIPQTIDSGIHSGGACLADLNQDGNLDLLVLGTWNQQVNTYGYYLNNGNRTFSPLIANFYLNGSSACAVIRDSATGHFAAFQAGTSQLAGYADTISIVDSDLKLVKQIGIPKQDSSLAGIVSATAIDVNGDGLLDFVINYEAWTPGLPGRKEVWLNQGNDNFSYSYTLDTAHNATGNVIAFSYQGDQYCYFDGPNGDAMLYKRVNGQLVPYKHDEILNMATLLGGHVGTRDWSIGGGTVYRGNAGLYMLQKINDKYYTQKL
jgi:hypothetical protein